MVNRVVPAADLTAAADEFALRLAAGPTTAISLTKRLLNASPDGDRAAAFLAEAMAAGNPVHRGRLARGCPLVHGAQAAGIPRLLAPPTRSIGERFHEFPA